MRSIVVIAHNLRSTHNIGSLFRTAEGLGINKLYLSGYTPYPLSDDDERLPHLANKITKQIHKTALDAESILDWEHAVDVSEIITKLKNEGYVIVGLEQAPNSLLLPDFAPPKKLAVVLGREVEGIETEVLELCDKVVEIPMFGKKESYNVIQAAAIALYHCRFFPFTSAK